MSDAPPVIDASKPLGVLVVGRKGSGKSTAARQLFLSYPYDKIVIDPTGDEADLPGVDDVTLPLPTRMPAGEDGPVALRFHPDAGSETAEDDIDRAVALALYPKDRRALVWIDEVGRAGRGPSVRRLLHESRHYDASFIACGPRPINIDPLWVGQSDLVLVYELPNPKDRQRIADNIGWEPKRFEEAMAELRRAGKHWFLLYSAHDHALWLMPPLPETFGRPAAAG